MRDEVARCGAGEGGTRGRCGLSHTARVAVSDTQKQARAPRMWHRSQTTLVFTNFSFEGLFVNVESPTDNRTLNSVLFG